MTERVETVILIHGWWMRGFVMQPYQHWLRARGYAVRKFSYPSWRGGLANNARLLSRFVGETPGAIIHLVGHSLGGLVALNMLSREADPRIRRVVLLGSPCAGSHCGSILAANPLFSAMVGRTFKDWLSLPRPCLPPSIEIGVIAGTRSLSFGRLIPGLARPNDGLIAVDETRLTEAKDMIVLNVSHSGMLISHDCAEQIANFLRAGSFIHA